MKKSKNVGSSSHSSSRATVTKKKSAPKLERCTSKAFSKAKPGNRLVYSRKHGQQPISKWLSDQPKPTDTASKRSLELMEDEPVVRSRSQPLEKSASGTPLLNSPEITVGKSVFELIDRCESTSPSCDESSMKSTQSLSSSQESSSSSDLAELESPPPLRRCLAQNPISFPQEESGGTATPVKQIFSWMTLTPGSSPDTFSSISWMHHQDLLEKSKEDL